MRMLNQDNDHAIKSLLLLLTQAEACELRDDLDDMLKNEKQPVHAHISDVEFAHELTVSIYCPQQMDSFSPRVKRLMDDDT